MVQILFTLTSYRKTQEHQWNVLSLLLVQSNPSVPPQTNLWNEQRCAAFDENEYITTEMMKIHTYQSQDELEQIKGISRGVQQVSEELSALRHPTIH